MSTIVVVKKDGYAAIAADTLTKFGESKDPSKYITNHNKIIRVSNSYVAIAGPTSAKTVLSDYFSRTKSLPALDSVENIFNTWIKLHAALKAGYFLKSDGAEDDSFESSQMDVLIANAFGIFGVSEHRAVQEFSRFYAYGRGSVIALGAMYAIFEDKERTALDIATVAIQAAAEFDDGTGLPVVSYQIKLK